MPDSKVSVPLDKVSAPLSKVSVPLAIKHDQGKQSWFAMPLEVLEPLAQVFAAGEKKYATFNCMNEFPDYDRRMYDALMRHLKDCQIDTLSRDEETDCYHLAQVAWNALMRLHHAIKERGV